jgi:hypothetical protein
MGDTNTDAAASYERMAARAAILIPPCSGCWPRGHSHALLGRKRPNFIPRAEICQEIAP